MDGGWMDGLTDSDVMYGWGDDEMNGWVDR